MHDVANELEKIGREIGHFGSGFHKLQVITQTIEEKRQDDDDFFINAQKQLAMLEKAQMPQVTPSVITSISDEKLAVLQGDDETERAKTIESLFQGLEDNEKEALLRGFCIGELETFTTADWAGDVTFDPQETGQFSVCFTGNAFFGCDDYNKEFEHDAVVVFKIEPLKKQIRFETEPPEVPEREGEEF